MAYLEEHPVHLEAYHEMLQEELRNSNPLDISYKLLLVNSYTAYKNSNGKREIDWAETDRGRLKHARELLSGFDYIIKSHKVQIVSPATTLAQRESALERAEKEAARYSLRNRIKASSKEALAIKQRKS